MISHLKTKIFLIALIFLIIIISILIILKPKNKPNLAYNPKYIYHNSVYPTNVYDIPVTNQIIPLSKNARPGTKRIIKYIVIHETDNYAKGSNSANHANYLSYNNKTYTSWHYTVDDTAIYHHVPDDEVAYHAGDKIGNKNGIGIELCVNSDGDFNQTFTNASKLVAYLLKSYDLDITAIKTHHDFNGKDCPHQILASNKLPEFKELVNFYLISL